jgi:hypothetical protein
MSTHSESKMKRLPFIRRPYRAKRILEIGGGHNPYEGITHAVDKFPYDDTQRADRLHVPEGVEFRQGDLEAIPFEAKPKFEFLYASHVLEHVNDPAKAVLEINRVSMRGYIETPSPLREQLTCPIPHNSFADFHTWFCWTSNNKNTIHMISKSVNSIGEFCNCENGSLAQFLFFVHRNQNRDVEPLLPRTAKSTHLYFDHALKLRVHTGFKEACQAGACAYHSGQQVRRWTALPHCMISKRFGRLRDHLASYSHSQSF